MKVVIFGATGMVGQGVVRECLLESEVERVTAVGRSRSGVSDPKLEDLILPDLTAYDAEEDRLRGFDACFFSLGVSSAGMSESDYDNVTYKITLAAAETLVRLNPGMTFVYVSGAGTDSTERGRVMWARVKGRTENALLALPFRAAYMFRPGLIQPMHGIRSRTASYRVLYAVLSPILGLARRWFPKYVLTTEEIGLAMLKVANVGAPKRVLETADLRALLG